MELTPEHEAKCLRCGRCCNGALPIEGSWASGRWLILRHMRCRYLDPKTKLCTVYETRFVVAPWCLTIEKAGAGGALWEKCPYSSMFPDGVRKVEAPDEEYLKKWPEIVHRVTSMSTIPEQFTWGDFIQEAEEREPNWVWEMRRGSGVHGPRTFVIRRRITLWERLARAIARWRGRV